MIFILSYEIIHIYALFQSEISGNVVMENGTWKIKVNNSDIVRGIDETFSIENINIEESSHVKSRETSSWFFWQF